MLGDSVLKYAVSSYLFLKYPKKHEGQLTARRTRAICNSNLHKLGIKNKLQVCDLIYNHVCVSMQNVSVVYVTKISMQQTNFDCFAEMLVLLHKYVKFLENHIMHELALVCNLDMRLEDCSSILK